ncbi:MAG: molybdopterin synthase sulfur carrier subunit, partial [Micrococcaceae bacterium]|nr:molybdopterin synthase sulfur carrier subunit [Micrococcaceae bacterium]
MAHANLEIPATLAPLWGRQRRAVIEYDAGTRLEGFLDLAGQGHPRFARRLRDETGAIRRYVNVFIDGENVRVLEGLDTVVPDGA